MPLRGAAFTYSDFSTSWEGELVGLVEVEMGEFSSNPGRCFLIVGSLTPTEIDSGVVTSPFSTPPLKVIADGRVPDEFDSCDTEIAVEAGYRSEFEATITVGTEFPFFSQVVVPGESAPDVDTVVVGSPSAAGALYFTPDLVDAIPQASPVEGVLPSDLELLPLVGASFTYEDFGASWEGTLDGLVEVGFGPFSSGTGRCLLLLGTVTPTSIEDGAVTNPFSAPSFDVIAGGRLVDSFDNCDRGQAEANGYGWILDASVTVGTEYPFFAELIVDGDPAPDLQAVVAGSAVSGDAVYYHPELIDEIPLR